MSWNHEALTTERLNAAVAAAKKFPQQKGNVAELFRRAEVDIPLLDLHSMSRPHLVPHLAHISPTSRPLVAHISPM